ATLTRLQGRLLLARLARGALELAAVAALGFGLICFLDAWIGQSTRGLQVAFVLWSLGILAVLALRVVRPLVQRPDRLALAALVERRFPELQECLSSSVALCNHRDAANGAEELVAFVNAEANQKCSRLDAAQVLPLKPRGLWWVGALLAIGVGL